VRRQSTRNRRCRPSPSRPPALRRRDRCVPGPRTLFTGIRKLPPASYLLWQFGRVQEVRYWIPPDRNPATGRAPADALEGFDASEAHMLKQLLRRLTQRSDAELQAELSQLAGALELLSPRQRLGNRYSFFGGEELPLGEAMDLMGRLQSMERLEQALRELGSLNDELDRCALDGTNRAFNLSWHDWMNLKNLVAVSRVITAAAIARKDSRGAHFRSDFPETGPLDESAFTSIRFDEVAMRPVKFTRVRPGQTLLKDAA